MSSENAKGIIMGGAALGAVALGYLWNKNHNEVAAEETTVVEEKLPTLNAAPIASPITNGAIVEKKVEIIEEPTYAAAELCSELNPAVNIRQEKLGAAVIEELAPIVQEVVHPVEIDEVQPVVHREIKQTEVHQVTQPIYDSYTAPVKEFNRELSAEVRPTLIEDSSLFEKDLAAGYEKSSLAVDATRHETLVKPAIIETEVKKDIIEIIQPVIHRDTVATTVVHTAAPIYEKLVEKPVLVREVLPPVVMSHEEVEAKLAKFNQLKVEESKGRLPSVDTPLAGKQL